MAVPITSAELTSEIAALSAKSVAGTISDDELRRAVQLLREGRNSIRANSKLKKATADGDAELDSLMSPAA